MSDCDWDPEAAEAERQTARYRVLAGSLTRLARLRTDPDVPLSAPLARDRDTALSEVLEALRRIASRS